MLSKHADNRTIEDQLFRMKSPIQNEKASYQLGLKLLHETIQGNLDLLDSEQRESELAQSAEEFDAEFYSSQLNAVGKHIHHGITRFALIHQRPSESSVTASATECQALAKLATQLAVHVATIPPARGARLRSLHMAKAGEILLALRALTENTISVFCGAADKEKDGNVAQKKQADAALAQHFLDTGVAWRASEILEQLPRSLPGVIRENWAQMMALAQDVVCEVKDSIAEYEAADEDGGGDNVDADSTSKKLPSKVALERELAGMRGLHKLLQLSTIFAVKVNALLKADALAKADSLEKTIVHSLNKLPEHASALEEHMDELGAICAEPPLPPVEVVRREIDIVIGIWRDILAPIEGSDSGALVWIPHDEAATKWAQGARSLLEKAKAQLRVHFPLPEMATSTIATTGSVAPASE